MKRFLLLLAALLLIGAWVGQAMMDDSGYVLIAYKTTSIETSIWVLLIAITVLFALLHWSFNLLSNWKSPAERLRRWSEARSDRKSGEKIIAALESEVSGDLWKARRLFLQAAEQSRAPALLFRQAARLAADQGDLKEANRILQKATKSVPDAEDAYLLEMARMDLKAGQHEKAHEMLRKLQKHHGNSTAVNRELVTLFAAQHQWNEMLPLLPELSKRNAIAPEDLKALRRDAAIAKLEAMNEPSLDTLNEVWGDLSYDAQKDKVVRRNYISQLTQLGDTASALAQLQKWIASDWDEDLVIRYGELRGENPEQQLTQAKGWSKAHPDNAALELTLARLSRRVELWGAAIGHYKQSLAVSAHAQTLLELAELLMQLGENQQATELLKSKNSPLKLPVPSDLDRETRKHLNH